MTSIETQPASGAGEESADRPRSRRDLLRTGASATVIGILGALGVASTTAAKNGDALRAGERISATRSTVLESRKGPAFQARATAEEGVGIQGEAAGKGASVGVQGLSRTADGVGGQFVASDGGTALAAVAEKGGVALRTRGRVQLSERSGISSVSGGAEFVIPVAGGLSDKSFVLATLQDHVPGVHVEAASVLDAEEGLIVVRLNQAVPRPARVGWLVLD